MSRVKRSSLPRGVTQGAKPIPSRRHSLAHAICAPAASAKMLFPISFWFTHYDAPHNPCFPFQAALLLPEEAQTCFPDAPVPISADHRRMMLTDAQTAFHIARSVAQIIRPEEGSEAERFPGIQKQAQRISAAHPGAAVFHFYYFDDDFFSLTCFRAGKKGGNTPQRCIVGKDGQAAQCHLGKRSAPLHLGPLRADRFQAQVKGQSIGRPHGKQHSIPARKTQNA